MIHFILLVFGQKKSGLQYGQDQIGHLMFFIFIFFLIAFGVTRLFGDGEFKIEKFPEHLVKGAIATIIFLPLIYILNSGLNPW
ncbi:hypothetical protein E6Q11_01965 [Candidatus Dojkabacteria bacterium]|uniref:Uncharacterized protein n=1 Tax=Candidatus Dojkabacteria bacterium TaxID=2099670 RepID=A0A5C7JBP0_9BACT|nr:MAG: hypothetical protein E6Q11_01965 [Candidatus Dojkabacteria bacterium]